MTYSSYDALVRRAVHDRQRIGGGGRWVVTAQTPLEETLRTSYGTWLRTTAVTGLASALLVPPAAAASTTSPVNAPGLPATNPQAIRTSRLEAPEIDRAQELLMDLTGDKPKTEPDRNRDNDPPQAATERGRQPKKPVSPPQNPPPARLPSAAEIPTSPTFAPPAPKPVLPSGPAAMGGLPPIRKPNLVDTERPRLSGQRPEGPAVTLEERARAAGSRPVTTERVDQWVTTVRTAMLSAGNAAASNRVPITFAEVSPTPKLGWSYRVQRGDSLWRISSQLWADDSSHHDVERTWRMLYEWNRDVLGPNSDRIYPGQVLEIPADAADVTTTLSGTSAFPIVKDVAR